MNIYIDKLDFASVCIYNVRKYVQMFINTKYTYTYKNVHIIISGGIRRGEVPVRNIIKLE
jgi:hypothetical protein